MPFKLRKVLELEITDKALEIVRQKAMNGEYQNHDELLDDLTDLMNVFPKKDRIKALLIFSCATVAVIFMLKFVG